MPPRLEEDAIAPPVEPQPEPLVPPVPEPQPEFPENGLDLDTSPMDFSDIIAQTNLELKRLGWTNEQGRQYLLETYGKRSRQLLNDRELLEFLEYLKSQPVP
ncbi:MAG: hypothetical protein SVX43_22565 [Cyanobacteriota bacterium]|nr:hypothetical protein [Cyanobacteriota bacterium]